MKKIETMVNMSVKELRQVAKDLDIAGRWDMTKAQLIEAIEKANAEKAVAEAKAAEAEKKATKKSDAMKVQRAFIEVGAARKDVYRYITITVKNVSEADASEYIDKVCAKMTEMDTEFGSTFNALRCPDIDEEAKTYTDMIAFEKAAGKIAFQRRYVGKLMTKAIAALKESK